MSDDATTAQREHWFSIAQRRAAGMSRQLTAQGFARASGRVLEHLREWGWRGRARWTTWDPESVSVESETWFPLWVIQIVVWCAPMIDLASVSRHGFEESDAMTRRLLHALTHDPEARAAALAIARLGREPVLEFLRRYDEGQRVRRCRYVAGF